MDIEQTKKMNFMIRELTRTGAVRNFEDAVSVAGTVYESGLPEPRASYSVTDDSDRMRDIVDQRIRHHLSDLGSQTSAELKKHAELRDNLHEEVKRLWQAVEELKQLAAAPKPVHKPVEVESTSESVPEAAAPAVEVKPVEQPREAVAPAVAPRPAAPSAPAPHPRAGNYQSDDVALEKFFYFGTGAKR